MLSAPQPPGPVTERLPTPDPTSLTTQQLYREIAQLQAAFSRELDSVQHLLEGRMGAHEQANLVQSSDHARRLDLVEDWGVHSRADHAGFLTTHRFDIVIAEWSLWRAAVDRHIAGTLVSRDDFELMVKRQEILVTKAETALIERVKMAMDAHAALHVAHDEAHGVMHAQTDLALNRAEVTMRETAELHAKSHEREHVMVKEADIKSEGAANVRFDLLTASMSRVDSDRASYVTRIEILDKMEALSARLDILDRQSALTTDRLAASSGAAGRLDRLEHDRTLTTGRDHGIGVSWQVLLSAVGIAAAVAALLVRFGL